MKNLWRRLLRAFQRSPSPQTIEAHRRLANVHRDDARINDTIASTNKMICENHFAPMIAKLFESRSQGK